MNIWVEFYKYSDNRENTHAQIKENASWTPPDPRIINRRFFDKMKDAKEFAKRMEQDGNHVSVKTDGYSI
tara:strand:- start:66 stop:275 length:210 start_codon:yes stop_codon:yes gene_type:complete